MLAAAPEEDPVTKEHTTLSSNTFPFLMSVRTRRCSCCALPEDTTTTTTAAHFPLACWHRGHSQCQPSRRWAGQQCFFSLPLSSAVLQLPMALFLPPARQRSVMSCDTAQMGADQAVPADKQSLVCASMPLSSPTSIWIRACSSSSRDQQTSLPFRRRHTHNAAPLPLVYGGESIAHCHPSQPPSNDALSPHTLP